MTKRLGDNPLRKKQENLPPAENFNEIYFATRGEYGEYDMKGETDKPVEQPMNGAEVEPPNIEVEPPNIEVEPPNIEVEPPNAGFMGKLRRFFAS